jgi:transposase
MPLCRSEDITTRGRFFKCLSCGLEANRDAYGVPNIGHLHEAALTGRWHTPCF